MTTKTFTWIVNLLAVLTFVGIGATAAFTMLGWIERIDAHTTGVAAT